MKREILFRGMNDNKRLVQGYFFQIWKDCFILWGTTNGVPNMTQVDPATVGQYTGLCDKNGVKIFEGDVVGCWDIYHENYAKGEVIKKITGEWLFYPYLQHGRFWSLFSNDIGECPVEVIGNIHDTPELAKEEAE